jgi:putative tricarboxylic transport membrane protein
LYGYHPGQIIAPVTAGNEIATAKNLTMIAAVAIDEQVMVVKADSPYKSLKEFVADAKQRSLAVAGTNPGQDDHICNRLLERAAAIKTRYVAFASGGEVLTALLGGHVDAIWANPGEFASQLEAKTVRALAIARPERFPLMADVPTFKEQGVNLVYQMFRGVVAPPEIPEESILFYEGMLKKMTQSQRWRDDYLKRNMLSAAWMDHKALTKLVHEQEETSKAILKELGLVK